jgi:hypothetical protein
LPKKKSIRNTEEEMEREEEGSGRGEGRGKGERRKEKGERRKEKGKRNVPARGATPATGITDLTKSTIICSAFSSVYLLSFTLAVKPD